MTQIERDRLEAFQIVANQPTSDALMLAIAKALARARQRGAAEMRGAATEICAEVNADLCTEAVIRLCVKGIQALPLEI